MKNAKTMKTIANKVNEHRYFLRTCESIKSYVKRSIFPEIAQACIDGDIQTYIDANEFNYKEIQSALENYGFEVKVYDNYENVFCEKSLHVSWLKMMKTNKKNIITYLTQKALKRIEQYKDIYYEVHYCEVFLMNEIEKAVITGEKYVIAHIPYGLKLQTIIDILNSYGYKVFVSYATEKGCQKNIEISWEY